MTFEDCLSKDLSLSWYCGSYGRSERLEMLWQAKTGLSSWNFFDSAWTKQFLLPLLQPVFNHLNDRNYWVAGALQSPRHSCNHFLSYTLSLQDDTSYHGKMIHLVAVRWYIFQRTLTGVDGGRWWQEKSKFLPPDLYWFTKNYVCVAGVIAILTFSLVMESYFYYWIHAYAIVRKNYRKHPVHEEKYLLEENCQRNGRQGLLATFPKKKGITGLVDESRKGFLKYDYQSALTMVCKDIKGGLGRNTVANSREKRGWKKLFLESFAWLWKKVYICSIIVKEWL